MRRLETALLVLVALSWPRAGLADDDASDGEEDVVVTPEVSVESEGEERDDELGESRRSDKIEEEELERRNAWQLSEALQWLTSTTPVDSTGTSTGLSVEGLPAAQLQVVEGGMPVSRPTGGPDGTSIDTGDIGLAGRDIEQIELHRGMGPPGSGPASGMVVDLERSELEPGLGFELNSAAQGSARRPVDSFPTQMLGSGSVSHGSDNLDLRLDAGTNGARGLDVNGDGTFDAADRRTHRVGGRSTWRPTDDSDDALSLDVTHDDGLTEGPYGQTSELRDVIDTRRTVGRLAGTWRTDDDLSIEHDTQVDTYDHTFSKRVLDSGHQRLKADTRQLRAVQDLLVERPVGDHIVGVELYGSAERIARTGETGELPAVDRLHGGLGLSDTWMPSSEVEIAGRAWADLHTDFDPGWMADVGAGWKLSDKAAVRLSASRTRRLPTAEELYLFFDHSEVGYKVTGNEDLHPERLLSGRAGLHLRPTEESLEVDIEAYYHRLRDLITTTQIDSSSDGIPTYTYENLSRAHTAGARLGLAARDVVWDLDLRADYSALPLAEDRDTGERLALRTRHQMLFEVERAWLDETLETWVDARARSDLSTPEGSPDAPGYLLLGAGVAWHTTDELTIRLDADNLLDQTNATWGPKRGVTLLGSVACRFHSKGDST
ncbi:MAG: TonB-dependent receptor plug domain-containing protein [Persicimonas sp.]